MVAVEEVVRVDRTELDVEGLGVCRGLEMDENSEVVVSETFSEGTVCLVDDDEGTASVLASSWFRDKNTAFVSGCWLLWLPEITWPLDSAAGCASFALEPMTTLSTRFSFLVLSSTASFRSFALLSVSLRDLLPEVCGALSFDGAKGPRD